MRNRGCMFLRDADGFCHLTNRCWAGRPCPKTDAEAERARQQLIAEIIRARDGWTDHSRARRARQPQP